ncbi:hypothetical protein DL546_001333 [Coniochaeta pulveracea]|uniref:Uncharacterized protein n=1 Tax=Coniochaeta pulveracea TaxID=177199 RepID=A0A420YKY1_9PEZI|nr:hypothetical protein DL546_001333 [Coniochaeta pulveracea]
MKTSTFLLTLVPAVLALDPRATACKGSGNNCQRGVSGVNGKPALSVRLADCSSFLAVTSTPAPTTTTITTEGTTLTTTTTTTTGFISGYTTETLPVAPTDIQVVTKRGASAVPTYATYCADPSAYASACACAGVTPTTVVLEPATVTEYAASATQTVLVTDCQLMNALQSRGFHGLARWVDETFH